MPIDLDFLRSLSEAFGPPGGEAPVRDMLRLYLKNRADEVWSDVVGNLFALKRATLHPHPLSHLGRGESESSSESSPPSLVGKGDGGLGSPMPSQGGEAATSSHSSPPLPIWERGPGGEGLPARILITAHMDEAALMVMQIGGNGLLSVRAAGKMEPRGLLGQVVHIGSDGVPGVIGVSPVHLVAPKAREDVPDLDDLTVDIGFDSRDETQGAVKRGDYIVPSTGFGRVGHLLKGKALDNRAGIAVALALLDGDYPCDLYLAFTVQEGVGARGARIAAYAVQPDLALILDGVSVDELPDEDDPPPPYHLGAGPILILADRGVLLDRPLTTRLRAVADTAGIPYQVLASRDDGSDARTVQTAHTGVPTALIGLPLRYPHLPTTLAHPADLAHAVRLLRAALESWTRTSTDNHRKLKRKR